MKKVLMTLGLAVSTLAFSQTNAPGITVSPLGTNGSTPITVTVTLADVCVPADKPMNPAWNTISFHSGAIVGGQVWQNVVEWNAAGSLTFNKVTDGVWSATFTPNDYYGVPVQGFCFVFNGAPNTPGDWDAEMKAFDQNGNCADFFWYFNDEPASIENNTIASVNVYPNPANDVINIQAGLNGISTADVIITDLAGRVITSTTISSGAELNLNVADYAPGTYLYSVAAGSSKINGKFNKQ
jgi:hypothetical protein